MGAHAKLSPSSSHRWMNCAGSVAKIGDESSPTNQAAMLGTAAHKLIEVMIIANEHDVSKYIGYAILVKADGDEETELYPPGKAAIPKGGRPGWFMFVVDERMIEGCQQTIDEVDRLRDELFSPEVFSEHYLDMSWLDPRLGGTADITLVEPFGKAVLVDHKNGYILVEAKDNDQLKQYAVGILHEHPDCDEVTVTISQPNAPHIDGLIRSETFSRDELKLYEIRMKEAADATSVPNAPLRAGDWCTWCPAKGRCEEFDAMLKDEADIEFSEFNEPPASLPMPKDNADLVRKLKWVDVISSWCSQIKGDAQRELENGNPVEGWKLVRGKANRKFTDPDACANGLIKIGVDNDSLWVEPKLKSPAQMEKLGVGREQRKLVKETVKKYAIVPQGQLTIVPDTDPRDAETAFDGAESEFAEFISGDDEDFA